MKGVYTEMTTVPQYNPCNIQIIANRLQVRYFTNFLHFLKQNLKKSKKFEKKKKKGVNLQIARHVLFHLGNPYVGNHIAQCINPFQSMTYPLLRERTDERSAC